MILTKVRAPYPEVTKPICRVPSATFTQNLNILYLTTCVGFNTIIIFRNFLLVMLVTKPNDVRLQK